MSPSVATHATLEVPAGIEVRLADVPFPDPFETIRRGSALISEKVGLSRAIGHGIYHAQDPATFAVGIVSSDLARFSEIKNAGKAGGGGESLEIALAATLGESVERYCMFFTDRRRTVVGSYRELSQYAVAPDELRLFTRRQIEDWRQREPRFGLVYFDDDTRISWTWAWSLTARRPRLVPTGLVYLESRQSADEAAVGLNASSGLAAGLTVEQAILSGLYEVVERDAFTVSWLHRRVQRRIVIDDPELQAWITRLFHTDHPDVSLEFYDITLDLEIPSLFTVMRRPMESGPALCLSSVTRLSPRDAVVKSLREMGQSLPYIRYLHKQLGRWEPSDDHRDLLSFDHHFMLYSKRPELIGDALSHLDEVRREVALSALPDRSTGSPRGDIQTSIEILAERGREVIVADITTSDVAEAGFRVVRVIVPGLVPLHGDHTKQYHGVRRLHEIPDQLGWERDGWNPRAGLNPRPHPFP